MTVSICMPWRNRLKQAEVAFPTWEEGHPHEICIVNDGSTVEDEQWLRDKVASGPLVRARHFSDTGYKRYPLRAYNECMAMGRGPILIQQSPEVAHLSRDLIGQLAGPLHRDEADVVFARVLNMSFEEVRWIAAESGWQRDVLVQKYYGEPWTTKDAKTLQHDLPKCQGWPVYTGHERPLPFFFCGAIRKDLWERLGGYNTEMENTFDRGADAAFAEQLIDPANELRILGLGQGIAAHIKHSRD